MRTIARSFPAILAVLLLCPALSAAERPPNILLVSVDAVHAEYLPMYGGEAEMPGLQKFYNRKDVYVFDRAYATAPWSLPSLSSLYTGTLPPEHGATDYRGRADVKHSTLPEALSKRNYQTILVADNPFLREQHGLTSGFSTHKELRDGHEVTAGFFNNLSDKRPFFAHLHYMDPHSPYRSHDRFCPGSGEDVTDYLKTGFRDFPLILSDRVVAGFRCRYRGELAYWDRQFGDLIEGLKERGLFDSTIVVVTADHGEAFLQHGRLGHYNSLHEEVLHVPLFIRLPAYFEHPRQKRTETPVSLHSLYATVVGFPEKRLGGVFKAFDDRYNDPVLASVSDGNERRYTLLGKEGQYKIIKKILNGHEEYELYRLGDNGETKLSPLLHRDVSERLKTRLNQLLEHPLSSGRESEREEGSEASDKTPSSSERRRELRGLGYF